MLEKSKWIWPVENARADEYAEFYEEVSFYGRAAELFISSDSNYTVYVNGSLAAFSHTISSRCTAPGSTKLGSIFAISIRTCPP